MWLPLAYHAACLFRRAQPPEYTGVGLADSISISSKVNNTPDTDWIHPQGAGHYCVKQSIEKQRLSLRITKQKLGKFGDILSDDFSQSRAMRGTWILKNSFMIDN